MAKAGRLGDRAQIAADAHGCPACPHPAVGPSIAGSPDVLINGAPALRRDDHGVHTPCCADNSWQALQGSRSVFLNGKAAFRQGDPTHHCGGIGRLVDGSDDVHIGDGGGASASKGAREKPAYSAGFEIHDRSTGEPLRGRRYRLRSASGRSIEGVTDDAGRTEQLTSSQEESLELELLDEEQELNFIDPQLDREAPDFEEA